MKTQFLTLLVIFLLSIGFVGFKVTHALFLDSASSTNNTFTAAQVSSTPTPTQTPESTPTPTPTPTSTPTPTPTPANIATHVVISEIQIATSSATTSDFVELYNPTSSPIDLNGHRLVRRSRTATSDTLLKSWTSSATVSAHGYYLWASSAGGYAAQIGADTSTSGTIGASSSAALKITSSGVIVDAVAWGSGHVAPLIEGSAFPTNPPGGQSTERKALSTSDATSMTSGADVSKGNGFDSNNNSTDFILRTISQPQNSSSATEMP